MIRRIHHLNIIVRELDEAAARYSILFGKPVPPTEDLLQRGVKLARFKIGETWIILVQPVDDNGEPARYLAKHGEGIFLVSGQVDDVRKAASKVSAQGINPLNDTPRKGLEDWQLIDLDPDDLFGVNFQLVESLV